MGCCGHMRAGFDAGDCCGSLRPIGDVVFPGVQDIIAAADLVAGWDAADLVATPVALWPDASGNGFDLAQAVGASQPSWGAATGPNGQPAVLWDGVDDELSNALLNLPAPGVTPTFVWGVIRQVTWAPGFGTLFQAGSAPPDGIYVFQSNVLSGSLIQYNGANANENATGLPLNAFKRVEAYYSNSIADYLKAGAVSVTGQNSGNLDSTAGWFVGAAFFGSPANIEVCELWIFNALPSPTQLAFLDLYVQSRYGAGLT